MKIFKYPLRLTDTQTIDMPRGAQILNAQLQNSVIVLWAIVDEAAEMVKREIKIYRTGHLLPQYPGDYIGTVQTANGHLIWHLFHVPEPITFPEPSTEWGTVNFFTIGEEHPADDLAETFEEETQRDLHQFTRWVWDKAQQAIADKLAPIILELDRADDIDPAVLAQRLNEILPTREAPKCHG